ncbi:serine protease [uncultured Cellulomonas sp.]|uniref:S1C family serine protease n=1 Tax=uncultured Cellulomonas sp. TaxID=189682 RepID=UPI0028EBCBEC|nr:serine protease [uncultured Cellulomonas sp.]
MTRRAVLAGCGGAVVAMLAMAGCAMLPGLPAPVPTNVVPSDLPQQTPTSSGNLSPDGFDSAQRMAVRIRNIGCGTLSTGSGFALDDHTLVTNRHVVTDSSTLQLNTYDGRDLTAAATSTADLADLAIVRTEDALPAAPELAETDPAIGATVTVVGYPLGRALTVTTGQVLSSRTDPLNENLGEVLVTDAPVEPGSSGSAVLDDDGRVVGVVYAKDSNGHSFVVPVSTLRSMLDDEASFTPTAPCTG